MTKKDSLAIKGIAILAMIFYHLFYTMAPGELDTYAGVIWSGGFTLILVNACHVCVPLFVFLTGYGLSQTEKSRKGAGESFRGGIVRYARLVLDQSYILIVVLFLTYIGGFGHNASTVWGDSLLMKIVGVTANALGIAGRVRTEWFCSSWWYIGLAVLWIFLVPVLYRIADRIGPYATIALGILLPSALGMDTVNDTAARYFPVLMCGIAWSAFDIEEKIEEYCQKDYRIKILLGCVLLAAIGGTVLLENRLGAVYLMETVMAVAIVILHQIGLKKIPFLKHGLAFLGKYSKYMWLLHVFIFLYWFREAIYGLHNIWIIFICVVALTWFLAFVLEKVKVFFRRTFREGKNFSRGLIISLAAGLTVLDYVVAVISSEMVYLTNDDGSIQSTLSGFLTGEPYPFHQFVNFFLTYLLAGIYSLIPEVNWWYLWSQLLMAVGIFLVHLCLMKITPKYNFPFGVMVGILAFLDVGFLIYPIANISFTIVPAVFGTGIVALLFSLEDFLSEKCRKAIILCSFFGYLLLLCHRKQTGMVILCYLLMAFLYYYFRDGFRWKKAIGKFVITAGIFLLATLALDMANRNILNQQNGEKFIAFNSARSQYMDYPHETYNENPEAFQKVGWDKDTYDLVSNWCFLDEDVNTEAFSYLSEQTETVSESRQSLTADILKSDACRPILILWAVSFLGIVFVLLCHFDLRTFLFACFNNIGTLILMLYQILQGRALYRTVIIVLLPAFVINVLFCIKNYRKLYPQIWKWMMVFFALCCCVPILEHTFDTGYRETVKASCEKYKIVTEYMLKHPENFYVTEVGVTNNINPAYIPQGHSNSISWGGSTYYSGEYYRRLEKNGFSELTGADFSRDNVYLISTTNAVYESDIQDDNNLFAKFYYWLRREYGATGYVLEETITDGVYVYHFIFEK